MSYISPLEELAEKFNIINFNIRELLHKLAIWSGTDEDSVTVRLKTQNAPYFEHHTIPSKKYISNIRNTTTWNGFIPTGTKFWGRSITDETTLTVNGGETFHLTSIDPNTSAKTNFMEYYGAGIEGDCRVYIDNEGIVGSTLDFVVSILGTSNTPSGENFIYFIDAVSGNILAKLGRGDLVSSITEQFNQGVTRYPKKFKVSVQLVKKPSSSQLEWVLFDLYQFPAYEYFGADNILKPIQ